MPRKDYEGLASHLCQRCPHTHHNSSACASCIADLLAEFVALLAPPGPVALRRKRGGR